MARNKIAVYVWIVDTIESHRHITLEELTALRQAWAAHIARSIYEQIGE